MTEAIISFLAYFLSSGNLNSLLLLLDAGRAKKKKNRFGSVCCSSFFGLFNTPTGDMFLLLIICNTFFNNLKRKKSKPQPVCYWFDILCNFSCSAFVISILWVKASTLISWHFFHFLKHLKIRIRSYICNYMYIFICNSANR